jgi:hypothetical protein
MGYQDREYMRGEGSGGAGRSNPLWWILGLIALILVVAYFRRGAMPHGMPHTAQQAMQVGGPTQTCRIELAAGPEQAERLLPVLREFFHQQGYDSTIHETADRALTAASFLRQSESHLWTQSAVYQHIGSDHASRKPQHTLVFQVHPGTADESAIVEQSLEVSRLLRLRLEAEFPGIVANIDDSPRPLAYDEYE